MTTLIDPRAYATAVKAALTATVGANRVYDYDDLPGSNGNAGDLPDIFVLVSIERRYNPNLNLAAMAGSTGWRVAVRSVGRTIDETRWAMFKVATALNEKRLTVAAKSTTPIQFESDQAPELDDGRFAALSLWTFAH